VTNEAQKLFDVQAAAAYLREIGASSASVNFVRTIIARGQLPHIRIGKKFFVSREAIDRWIQNRERRAK
jgi:excisionase family DNA binding protein